ncbi:MAG TPA: hypothetical protein VIY47_15800, partial [Ignavibacteriaceae bacterium]
MFAKKFQLSGFDEWFVSTTPFWKSMLEQQIELGAFDARANGRNHDVLIKAFDSFSNTIFMVSESGMDCADSASSIGSCYVNAASDEANRYPRKRYSGFIDKMKELIRLNFNPTTLNFSTYPDFLQRLDPTLPQYNGSTEIFGDFGKQLNCNPLKFNFLTMYLMNSAFESEGFCPIFSFDEFNPESRENLKLLMNSEDSRHQISQILQETYLKYGDSKIGSYKIMEERFNQIRDIVFESFCLQKLSEFTGVSDDSLKAAKFAAKEMWDTPKD